MARPPKIDGKYEDEIKHLMIDLRWGSRTTEKYMQLKHGFEISDSALRMWRQKYVEKAQAKGELLDWEPPGGSSAADKIAQATHPNDTVPDILQRRVALIALQEERIKLDVQHELTMGKTFNTTVREIELLNKMLSDAKTDMQDIGLWPSREGQPTVVNNIHAQAVAAAAAPAAANENGIAVDPDVLAKIGRKILAAKNELAVEDAERKLKEQGIEA